MTNGIMRSVDIHASKVLSINSEKNGYFIAKQPALFRAHTSENYYFSWHIHMDLEITLSGRLAVPGL